MVTTSNASTQTLTPEPRLCKLLSVPLEIQNLIISYLRGIALKQLRLTCRHIKSLAEPQLFHTLYIGPTARTIIVFISLATSHLRNLIYEIVWDNRCIKWADEKSMQLAELDPSLRSIIGDENMSFVKDMLVEETRAMKLFGGDNAFRGPAEIFFKSLIHPFVLRIETVDRVSELMEYPITQLRETGAIFRSAAWATTDYPDSQEMSRTSKALRTILKMGGYVNLDGILIKDTLKHWLSTSPLKLAPSRHPDEDDDEYHIEFNLTYDEYNDIDPKCFKAKRLIDQPNCGTFVLKMHHDGQRKNPPRPYINHHILFDPWYFTDVESVELVRCCMDCRDLNNILISLRLQRVTLTDCRIIGSLRNTFHSGRRFISCYLPEHEDHYRQENDNDVHSLHIENAKDDYETSIWAWYDCAGELSTPLCFGSQNEYHEHLRHVRDLRYGESDLEWFSEEGDSEEGTSMGEGCIDEEGREVSIEL